MKMRSVLCGVLVASSALLAAEDPAHDLAYYARAAGLAYQAKDYPAFLDASLHAQALQPDHPRFLYNLACAHALAGKPDEAIAGLERLAAMGLVYAVEKDDDFASIRESASFRAVVARFHSNGTVVHQAERAFAIAEKGLIAEGIAYDPAGRSFYVSSVRKRKVVRIRDSKIADFLANRKELSGAFGIRVDSKRRRLWVTTGVVPQMIGFREEEDGRSGLLEYDLASGKLRGSHVLPGPDKHNVADLTIDSNGTVYVSDSRTPAVYVLRKSKGDLERLRTEAPFVSPQGLALSKDEKKLYVADYARGVFVIDLETLGWVKLGHPDSVCLHGIDGMAYANGALYATQNGTEPKRVVKIALDETGSRAERLDVLEQGETGEPTLGAVVGDSFYFIADGGWDQVDEKGVLAPDAQLRNHTILRVKL
jgi:sugar lactone lactonase YvrE